MHTGNPFGGPGPAQSPGGGISLEQALSGFGDAPLDARYPKMQPGHNYVLQVEDTKFFNGNEIGPAIVLNFLVLQSDCPQQPAGSRVAHLLSGFANRDAQGFAFSDLKMFMLSVLRSAGVHEGLSGEQWMQAAGQMCANNIAAGQRCMAQTSAVSSKRHPERKPKLKAMFQELPKGA